MKKILLLLLLAPLFVQATEVYRWTDAQGNVHFGDDPGAGNAKSVQLNQPSVYSAPISADEEMASEPAIEPEQPAFHRVEVLRPTAGETFRSAEGIIPVEVSVESGGSEGLVYRFILDGTVVAEESQPLAQLSGVERGAHGLQVVLLDANGQQLAASPMVTFYLHQPIAKKKAPR